MVPLEFLIKILEAKSEGVILTMTINPETPAEFFLIDPPYCTTIPIMQHLVF